LVHASLFVNVESGLCVFCVHTRSQHLASWPAFHPVVWEDRLSEVRSVVGKFVRRAVERVATARQQASTEGKLWESVHPAIQEYLTEANHDDGSPRETSMLCIFVEDGFVKLSLQDREEGRSMWVSAPSLPEALNALERNLQDGVGEWRLSSRGASQKGKKR
jgi:hypothetical protein